VAGWITRERHDQRTATTSASPEQAFRPILRIGGTQGWYFAGPLWRIRGWLDTLVGGPGLRRGRLHPEQLAVGDHLDWWRVAVLESNHRLLLKAEMRVPGEATLEFVVEPHEHGSRITQTARFHPSNVWGVLYWWAMLPFHGWLFPGMLRQIIRRAEAEKD
jgi:hypothetical protein